MRNKLKLTAMAIVIMSGWVFLAARTMAKDFESVEFLRAIDVFDYDENTAFLPDDEMTREQMAAVSVRLLGIDDELRGFGGSSGFDDVPAGHWAEGYIYMMRANGIMNGISETEFGLEQKITYEQAIKVIVSIMGFGSYAELEGGYPDGYIKWASDHKILSGVKGEVGKAISRDALAHMIYNAVEQPILQISGISGSNYIGTTDKDVTILSEYLHIRKQKGIVTANSHTDIKSASGKTQKGSVKIDGEIYDTGRTKAEILLGQSVIFYAADETAPSREIKIIKPQYDDEAVEVTAEDIVKIDLAGIDYDEGAKKKSKRFSPLLDVIYNEKAYSGLNESKLSILKMKYGGIRMIDNNNDDIIDVLLVRNYTNHFVSAVNTKEETVIFDDTTPAIKVSGDFILMDEDGMDINIGNVRADGIISIMRNPETGEAQAAIFVSDWVRGTIESINTDEGQVKIFGNWYDYDASVENKLRLGAAGVFYLNGSGIVCAAYIDDLKKDNEYAYLIRVTEDDILDDDILICRLMTLDGEIKRYKISSKTSLNNQKLGSGAYLDYVVSTLKSSKLVIGDMSQPVKVKLEGDTVTSMNTMDSDKAFKGNAIFKDRVSVFVNSAKVVCYGNEKTKVMYVGSDDNVYDEDYYGVGSVSDFAGDKNFCDGFAAYDIDYENGTRVAGLIVASIADGNVSTIGRTMSRTGVITDINSAVDFEGNSVYEITVANPNDIVTLSIPDDAPCPYVCGDLIAFVNKSYLGVNRTQLLIMNSKSDIDSLEDAYVYPSNGDMSHSFRYAVGVIHKISGNYITVGGVNDDDKDCNVYYVTDAKVVVYDGKSKREKIVTGTKDLLSGFEYGNSPGSRVVIYTSEARVTGIILYK